VCIYTARKECLCDPKIENEIFVFSGIIFDFPPNLSPNQTYPLFTFEVVSITLCTSFALYVFARTTFLVLLNL